MSPFDCGVQSVVCENAGRVASPFKSLAATAATEHPAGMRATHSMNWWITDITGPRALAMMASPWGKLLQGSPYLPERSMRAAAITDGFA